MNTLNIGILRKFEQQKSCPYMVFLDGPSLADGCGLMFAPFTIMIPFKMSEYFYFYRGQNKNDGPYA